MLSLTVPRTPVTSGVTFRTVNVNLAAFGRTNGNQTSSDVESVRNSIDTGCSAERLKT